MLRLVGVALASLITAHAAGQGSSSQRATRPGAAKLGAQGKFPETTATVGLNDEAELARAVLQYDGGRYRECVDELEPLVTSGSPRLLGDADLVERGRVYLAACLIGIGEPARADEVLKAAIRASPQMSPPDSLVFPEAVIDRFLRVRQELIDEIRRAEQDKIEQAQERAAEQARRLEAERWRTKELEYLASQQLVVHENYRWIAALPFGVGQFQNRDTTLGWLFLTSELVAAGTMVGSLGVYRARAAQLEDTQDVQRRDALKNDRQTAYSVILVSSWALIGLATVGIVEAQLSFVPEFREMRTRPLPERLRAPQTPTAPATGRLVPLPSGGTLELSWRF